MLRGLVIFAFVLVFQQAWTQTTCEALRVKFDSLYQNGDYEEAIHTADQIILCWKKENNSDSVYFYRYRRAHTYGVSGDHPRSVQEADKVIADLERHPPLPGYMGGLYYTAGSNRFFMSQFDEATALLNRSLDFEESRPHPDTLTLAKATEWKGLVCIYTDRLPTARVLVEQALKLRYAVFDSTALEIAYNLNSLASVYDEMGMKPEAKKAFEEAYKILKQHLPPDHPQLLSLASNLSTIKSDMGEIDEALKLLENAIAVHESQNAAYPLMSEYNNLGGIYIGSLKDYKTGRVYLQRSLEIADSVLPPNHFYRANLYDGIGASYYGENNYQLADSFFSLGYQERLNADEVSASELGQSAYNLGMSAEDSGDTTRARKYYTTSLNYRMESFGADHPKTANSIFGLANIDWLTGHRQRALQRYRTSLSIYTSRLSSLNTWPLENLVRLAECHRELNQPDSSRYYLNQAWTAVCKLNGEPFDPEKLASYPIRFVDPYVLDIIDFNLKLLLDQDQFAGSNHPVEGMQLMQTMDSLMAELWPMLNFENETGSLLPKIKSIYRRGVLLAALQQSDTDPRQLDFLYLNSLEQSHSASTRAALQNRQAMQFANIPDSVLTEDRKLRREMRFVQASASEMGDTYNTDLRFQTMNRWRSFQSELKNKYPKYYNLRYAPAPADPGALQSWLRDNRAGLVAYFVENEDLIAIVSAGDGFTAHILNPGASWQDSVMAYRDMLSQRAESRQIARMGHYLYSILWQPIEKELSKNVVIVPDGVLNFLNFETLLPSKPGNENFATWDWLIRKHTFLTRTTLTQQTAQHPKTKNQVLALAPGFSDELKQRYKNALTNNARTDSTFMHWVQTPWSVSFAEKLSPRGQVFTGSAATVDAFRQHAGDAEILHFGTHAHLSDNRPLLSYLALTPDPARHQDGYLYAYELYNLPLNARLAVLTACETGVGSYREGDGVISLAHAFQYAGCPNVIYSLWQIDDQQSAWLIDAFYSGLDQGDKFSDALRNAKLSYIENHTGELSAPYYWAGIMLTGTDGKLSDGETTLARSIWLVIGALMAAFLIFIAWSKWRKSPASPKNPPEPRSAH